MNVTFALFADAANLSQEGKLNILGVFDAVQVATLPAVHPRAHLVVHLKGTPQDAGPHSVTLRWLNPDYEEIWSTVGELNVGAPPPGVTEMDMPLIAALDLPIDRAGTYMMAISVDDQAVVQVPLHVRGGVPAVRPGTLVS
jgi:hypothetical protein